MSKTTTKTVVPTAGPRFETPSRLGDNSRRRLSLTLNERLVDGLDLHSQIKVAHWNVKGPHFAALHAMFDSFASSVLAHTDQLAERAVVLGGLATGTARQVAKLSRIPEYPSEVVRDLEHVRLLSDRFDTYADGLRISRTVAEEEGDIDTADLLTAMLQEVEKFGWFLRATSSA